MEEKKPSESKEQRIKRQSQNFPNPQEMDRVLAQLIGWTANLIGMVRKFPQGKDRDQTVFTTRKVLKQLRALREGDTQALVQKEGRGEGRRPRRREGPRKERREEEPRKEEVKKEPEVKVKEEKPVTPQAPKEEDVGKAPEAAKQPPKAAQPEVAKPAKSKPKRESRRTLKKASQKRKPRKTRKEVPQKAQKKADVAEKTGKETKGTEEKIIFKKEPPKRSF